MTARFEPQNLVAGSVVTAIGVGAAIESSRYQIGSPTKMGPGFFPVMLAGALILLGLVIAISGDVERWEDKAQGAPDMRGWTCIIAGMLSFIVLGEQAGLAPAAFLTVFVSALGDRRATIKGSALLAAGITALAVLLFGYALQLQLPILVGVL
jgi:hypothetical protein